MKIRNNGWWEQVRITLAVRRGSAALLAGLGILLICAFPLVATAADGPVVQACEPADACADGLAECCDGGDVPDKCYTYCHVKDRCLEDDQGNPASVNQCFDCCLAQELPGGGAPDRADCVAFCVDGTCEDPENIQDCIGCCSTQTEEEVESCIEVCTEWESPCSAGSSECCSCLECCGKNVEGEEAQERCRSGCVRDYTAPKPGLPGLNNPNQYACSMCGWQCQSKPTCSDCKQCCMDTLGRDGYTACAEGCDRKFRNAKGPAKCPPSWTTPSVCGKVLDAWESCTGKHFNPPGVGRPGHPSLTNPGHGGAGRWLVSCASCSLVDACFTDLVGGCIPKQCRNVFNWPPTCVKNCGVWPRLCP